MTNTILGLRTVIYNVGDLKAAKEWYARVFKTKPYFDEAFYVGFEIGGYELGLQPEEKLVASKEESVIAYWGVEDIDAEYDGFIAAGAVAFEAPANVGGDIKVAKLKDAWGNVIGLIFNPHFKILS